MAALTALITSATVASTVASAQVRAAGTGVIKGTVVEAGNNRPLADVTVSVEGTQRGGASDPTGTFTITGVSPGNVTLRVRRIGYSSAVQNAAVTAGGTTTVAFQIRPAALSLDQVVVTGTAGATEKRAIGNAVTSLDVADITQRSSMNNVTDVLQGKTPGLTLVPGSGAPGTAADIRIRGISSLSATNRPIFYVDGVRYSDQPAGNYNPSGTGYAGGAFSQGASALDAINPEDIERIEVIKGPAAATLYGADAAGGVIPIITKKGRRDQKASWTVKGEYGATDWALATPVNYTTCTAARIASLDTVSTATGKSILPSWPGCRADGVTAGTVLTDDPLHRDPQALRTGLYQNLVASLRGGSDRYNYYLSADRSLDQGVFYNSYDNRKSARGNFGYTLSNKLDFNVNTSYIQSALRLPLSDDAAQGLLFSVVRGKPGQRPVQEMGFANNSPETANQYDNETNSERTIFGATTNYRPFSWFQNRVTVGLDYNNAMATVYYPPGAAISQSDYPLGFLAQQVPVRHLYTFDYAGTVTGRLLPSLTSDFSIGAQGNKNEYNRTEATGSGLPSPEFRLVGSATTVSGSTSFSEQASLGYFVQERLGLANRLFLTGGVRADDNSAFGVTFNKVYYPKASLSYVASEEPRLQPLFHALHADNFKFRYAYGQAGRSPGPYDALRTYVATKVITGSNTAATALTQGATGNPDLHAERGSETEIGFDASFFSSRIGVEFTAYNKKTSDALISLPNAPSYGFTASRFINFGAVKNTGTELGLTFRPIDASWLTWESQFNYSTNANKVTRLAYQGLTEIDVYDPYLSVARTQRIIEGYPVAGWWAQDAVRNADGTYATDAKGALVVGPLRYVGPSTPTSEGSFSNTFTIAKNFRLYGLIDFKEGFYLLNQKSRNRDQGANRNSKEMNNGTLSSLDSVYYNTGAITAPWIQHGDFVKLRDVSLGYTLPTPFATALHVSGATLTVAGHNLGFLSKRYPGIDPEVNFIGQGTFLTSSTQFLRADSYTMPMLRRWTTSLTLNF
ncbi:MAG: SusC/RagA family TonB-linked outer membrane protein [Gemmatimonadaceae bacterium]